MDALTQTLEIDIGPALAKIDELVAALERVRALGCEVSAEIAALGEGA